jgi:hypothetical protein
MGEFLGSAVVVDEIEEVDIALGIADDAGKIVQLKEGDVPVVILDTLLLELAHLVGGELVLLVGGLFFLGERDVVGEEGLAAEGPLAIGPPGGFHLDEPEIDPQLNLFLPVGAENSADFDLAGFMRPIAQQVIKVQTHWKQYRNECGLCQLAGEAARCPTVGIGGLK